MVSIRGPRRLTGWISIMVAGSWVFVAAPSGASVAADTNPVGTGRVEAFRPVTAQQVEQARRDAVAASGGLERFLARGSADNAAAWKEYLRWDDLQQSISADGPPDPRQLADVLAPQYSGEPGLELPPFAALRDALLRYRRLLLAENDENVATLYQEQLAAIEKDLESGIAQSGGPLGDLAARLEWLEQLGQAPKLVKEIRQQFSRPNLLVSTSAETINRGFDEPVFETTPVSEMILQTYVTGTAQTVGNVSASLLPMNDQAAIEVTLSGVATSQTVGRQSPVRDL